MTNVDIVFFLQTTILETIKSKDFTKCLPRFLAMIFDNARLGTRFPLLERELKIVSFCFVSSLTPSTQTCAIRCHVLKQTLTMSVKMKLRVCRDVDSKMLFGSMPVIAGVISAAKGNWTCWRCY